MVKPLNNKEADRNFTTMDGDKRREHLNLALCMRTFYGNLVTSRAYRADIGGERPCNYIYRECTWRNSNAGPDILIIVHGDTEYYGVAFLHEITELVNLCTALYKSFYNNCSSRRVLLT